MVSDELNNSPLGKEVEYVDQYDASLLCPVPRANLWQEKGYISAPFRGCDIWNAYEISWLNYKGLPRVGIAEFRVPCSSPNLTESKSFKLYLNSFNQTKFKNTQEVIEILQKDLSACAGETIEVDLNLLGDSDVKIQNYEGLCLDNLDIEITSYEPDASLLKNRSPDGTEVHEKLYSHLLKSNCPITGQPDWASVSVEYSGPAIDHGSLLKYLVSYRNHGGFHEQCVESIFLDILEQCKPSELTVYARYLRRGGLDINPFRSNTDRKPGNTRLIRQ